MAFARFTRILAWLLVACGAVLFVAGLVVDHGWRQDRALLRQTALAAVAGAPPGRERIARLTHWVYADRGFAKNHAYFLSPRLEATPVQILRGGGDCADKSRLLAAMAREIGERASLAMLFPCRGCVATHTVALIDTPRGWTPVDPVYDIVFPGRTAAELRADPGLLPARLDKLVAARGRGDKIALYKRDIEAYGAISTFNWDKNALTRAAAGVLRATGQEPWQVPRPALLDDPKRLVSLAALIAGAFLLLAGLIVLGARRRPRAVDLAPAAF